MKAMGNCNHKQHAADNYLSMH